MGYYTSFSFQVLDGDDGVTDYEQEITEISGYSYLFGDTIKWYEHQGDMKTLSSRHPTTLFKLSGDGEENGDLWEEYYLNGKMQRCTAKITFDPYDPTKLA